MKISQPILCLISICWFLFLSPWFYKPMHARDLMIWTSMVEWSSKCKFMIVLCSLLFFFAFFRNPSTEPSLESTGLGTAFSYSKYLDPIETFLSWHTDPDPSPFPLLETYLWKDFSSQVNDPCLPVWQCLRMIQIFCVSGRMNLMPLKRSRLHFRETTVKQCSLRCSDVWCCAISCKPVVRSSVDGRLLQDSHLWPELKKTKVGDYNPGSKVSKFGSPFLSISYPTMVREWPSCCSMMGIFSVIVICGIFIDSNAFLGVPSVDPLTVK